MYQQLYQAYANDKENPKTFAGAMATFVLGSHMAYHYQFESGAETNAIFQALAKQFDRGIKDNPADYKKMSAREIKDSCLRMTMLGMQMMIAVAHAKQNNDDATLIARLKESGREGLETAFGTSADSIHISRTGLSPQ